MKKALVVTAVVVLGFFALCIAAIGSDSFGGGNGGPCDGGAWGADQSC